MQEEQNNYVGLIITILFMLLYFFAGSTKKKGSAHKKKEGGPVSLPASRPVKQPPPVKVLKTKVEDLPSYYEAMPAADLSKEVQEPSFASAISQGLSMQVDLDPAYKIRHTKANSFARKTILQSKSLKDLIVVEAVLKRPYE